MMKSTRKEKVKPVKHQPVPNKFVSEGMRNSVVLRTLMQHFSNTELLKLSLVNKLWNYEAKSLIRERDIGPKFHSGRSTCRELDAFASDLRQMDVVPFTGMNIQVRKSMYLSTHECVPLFDYTTPAPTREKLDSSYNVILYRMPLKRLSLLIRPDSAHQNHCQAILLAKKLLRHFSEVIEELAINGQHEQFIQDYNIADLSFRRLKTLKIIRWPKEGFVCETNLIGSLASRAPNLQQLYTPGSLLPFMDEILDGSAATVVPSDCLDPFDTQLPGSGFKRLRIEKIILPTGSANFSVEKFNTLIPALLQSCRITLNTLHIDVKCFGPLISYGLCLPNVRELEIYAGFSHFPPSQPVVKLLKAFDFTRILPALTKVDVTTSHSSTPLEDIQSFTEQGNAALKEHELLTDRAVNIKHLCVFDYLSHRTLPFLSQTFPNIERLSVEDKWSSMFLCDQIWNHWKHLKGIETTIPRTSHHRHENKLIDSILCGIHPEEVAELRGKDDEFLKAVNIVPVMPSIACFKDLRTLELTYKLLSGAEGRSDLLCSKVTGLLVFARCANLSVTIHNKFPNNDCVEALDHMKPYATVVFHPCTAEAFDFEVE